MRNKIHDNIRLAALLLFVLSLPFSILLNNISVFLLVFNWLAESSIKIKWRIIKNSKMLLTSAQFYIIFLIGMLYSQNLSSGVFQLEKKLTLLVFPLVILTSTAIKTEHVKLVFKAFIFSCTTATLICLLNAVRLNYEQGQTFQYLYNAVVHNVHAPDKYPYFNYWFFTNKLFVKPINMHPVYMAMYMVFAVFLALWLWWDQSASSKLKRAALIGFFIYSFIIVVMLASRTQLAAFLLFTIGLLFYIIWKRGSIFKGILLIASLAIIGMVVVLPNPVMRERFLESNKPEAHYSENKYGEGGLSLRKYKWKYAAEVIKNQPIFGTGTGDAQDELQKEYLENNFKIGYEEHFNAHNQYIQAALELGVFGLFSLLISFGYPFILAFKNREWLYLFFITLFAFSCTTESMLEVNKGIVFYAFFNSILGHLFFGNTWKPSVIK